MFNSFILHRLLLVVSLSWAMIVDLTPADQRPYVGGSSDNTELSLITGYNGVQRLLGQGGRGGLLSALLGGSQNVGSDGNPGQAGDGNFQPPAEPDGNGPFQPPQVLSLRRARAPTVDSP